MRREGTLAAAVGDCWLFECAGCRRGVRVCVSFGCVRVWRGGRGCDSRSHPAKAREPVAATGETLTGSSQDSTLSLWLPVHPREVYNVVSVTKYSVLRFAVSVCMHGLSFALRPIAARLVWVDAPHDPRRKSHRKQTIQPHSRHRPSNHVRRCCRHSRRFCRVVCAGHRHVLQSRTQTGEIHRTDGMA